MTRTSILLAGVSGLVMSTAAVAQDLPQARDSYFLAAAGQLQHQIDTQPITSRAKNIILFVGDGMSIPTITAARIYEGQMRGVDGESNNLTIDTFPYSALVKTYTHNAQVADSAPTATAMVTGVKTLNGVIGVNQTVAVGDCASAQGQSVTTLFEQAEAQGLATGVVSTARITHATPAATYAHTPMRDWESDRELGAANAALGCKDIADQLVNWTAGDGFEVVLGGGRAYFIPETLTDPENANATGRRRDGRDLTAEWTAKGNNNLFVWNAEGFNDVDWASGAKVLGLFEPSHMQYEADRANDAGGEPSLAEMTTAAITRLSQNTDGYVLMVEGGRIDHAHHAGNAARALIDAVAFDAAVKQALEMTSREDTLIVVTADHSHAFFIQGYPSRNNPILGLATTEDGATALGGDGKPYTTLGYGNGPGGLFPALAQGQTVAEPAGVRPDLSGVDTKDVDFLQQAAIPMGSETHTGDDVGVFAWGPYAHLFHGVVEQNLIYHVMNYAMQAPAQRAAAQ